jgi:hypothetical protein
VPLNVIQRQLGHADLGVTSVYLGGGRPCDARTPAGALRRCQAPAGMGTALTVPAADT